MARLIDADALDAHSLPMDMGGCILIDDVTEMIANAPTIEPVKQGWISVKDRLPEKGKSVLVYWDDGFDIGEYVGGEVGDDVYWMPLPELPKNAQERVR